VGGNKACHCITAGEKGGGERRQESEKKGDESMATDIINQHRYPKAIQIKD